MLNRRERILAILVLASAVAAAMYWSVERLLLNPLHAANKRLHTLEAEVSVKQQRLKHVQAVRKQIAQWEQMSLPPHTEVAQSRYHAFLLELMQECRLEERVVTAENVQPGEHFTRIPFTLTARSTLSNLTEFLYRFYQPRLLHQVRSLYIRNVRGGSEKLLELRIGVEALALDGAPARSHLIPEGQESHGAVLAGAQFADFAVIARQNIFEPFHEPPKPAATPTMVKEPAVDAAKQIYLTGATDLGDQPQAWLSDRRTDRCVSIRPGEQLHVAGIKGKVTSVTRTGIILQVDDRLWSLRLGKNLREMQDLTESE
jgi:hypothetical protein